MKEHQLQEILHKIKTRPDLKKKIKVFLAIAFVGLIIIGGTIIWAGISLTSYLYSQIQPVQIQSHIKNLEGQLKPVVVAKSVNCWAQVQTMMNAESLFNQPLSDNFSKLKTACWPNLAPVCEGNNCEELKQNTENKDWSEK